MSALARKGLLLAGCGRRPDPSAEGWPYDTGIIEQVLHRTS